ncbi:unnamed protein product [Sympodiomycopsis kandeliae]
MTNRTRSQTVESDSAGSSTEVDKTPQPTWCPAFKGNGIVHDGQSQTDDDGASNETSLDGLGISTPMTLQGSSPLSQPVSPNYTYKQPSSSPVRTMTRPGHSRRPSRISVSTRGHSRGNSISSTDTNSSAGVASANPLDNFPQQKAIDRRDKRDSYIGLPYKNPSVSHFDQDYAIRRSSVSSTSTASSSSNHHSRNQSEALLALEDRGQRSILPAISDRRKLTDENKRRSQMYSFVYSSRRGSHISLSSTVKHDPDSEEYRPPSPAHLEATLLEQRSKSLPGGSRSGLPDTAAHLPPGFTILLDQSLQPQLQDLFPRRESAPVASRRTRQEQLSGSSHHAVMVRDDSPLLLVNTPPDRSVQYLDAPLSPAPDDGNTVDPYENINWSSFIKSGYSMSFAQGAASPLHVGTDNIRPRAVVINMERGLSNESTMSQKSIRKHSIHSLSEHTNFMDISFPASDNEDSISDIRHSSTAESTVGYVSGKSTTKAGSHQGPERTGIAWLDDELEDELSPPNSPLSVGFSHSPPPKSMIPVIETDSDGEAPWMTPPEKPVQLFADSESGDCSDALGFKQSTVRPKHKQAQRLGLGLNVHKANHNPAAIALRKLSPITPPPRTALPALPPISAPLAQLRRNRNASISFSPTHDAASHFPDVHMAKAHRRRPSTGSHRNLTSKQSFNASKRQSEAELFSESSGIPEEVPDAGVSVSLRAQTSLGFVASGIDRSISESSVDTGLPVYPSGTTRHRSRTIKSLPTKEVKSSSSSMRSSASTRPPRPPRSLSRPSSSDTKASHGSLESQTSRRSLPSHHRRKSSKEAAGKAGDPLPPIGNRNASLTKYSRVLGLAGATPPRRPVGLPVATEPTAAEREANLRRLRLMGEDIVGLPLPKASGTRPRSGSASSVANQGSFSGAPTKPLKMRDRLSTLLSPQNSAQSLPQVNEQRASVNSMSSTSTASSSDHSQMQSSNTQRNTSIPLHRHISALSQEGTLAASSDSSVAHSQADSNESDRHIPIYPPGTATQGNAASSTLAAARMNVWQRRQAASGSHDADQAASLYHSRRSLDSDRSFPATVSVHSMRSVGSGGDPGLRDSMTSPTGSHSSSQGYLGLGMWTGSVGAGANASLPVTSEKRRARFAAGSLGRKTSLVSSKTDASNPSRTLGNNNSNISSGRKSLSDFFDRTHFLESIGASGGESRATTEGNRRPSLSGLFHHAREPPSEQQAIINPFHLDETYYQTQEESKPAVYSTHTGRSTPHRSAAPPSSFARSASALNRPNQADARAREAEMVAALNAVLPGDLQRRNKSNPSIVRPARHEVGQDVSENPASDTAAARKQNHANGWGSIRKRASRLIG